MEALFHIFHRDYVIKVELLFGLRSQLNSWDFTQPGTPAS